MSFKNFLKKSFEDKKQLSIARYKSAKFAFIMMTLIFFLNYFFVWAQFYYDFFIVTLPYTYILYLLSFLYYVFYFFKLNIFSRFNWNIAEIIFFFFLLLLFLLFSSIVVFWKNIPIKFI